MCLNTRSDHRLCGLNLTSGGERVGMYWDVLSNEFGYARTRKYIMRMTTMVLESHWEAYVDRSLRHCVRTLTTFLIHHKWWNRSSPHYSLYSCRNCILFSNAVCCDQTTGTTVIIIASITVHSYYCWFHSLVRTVSRLATERVMLPRWLLLKDTCRYIMTDMTQYDHSEVTTYMTTSCTGPLWQRATNLRCQ